jgi:hypothetical protein
MVDRRNPRQRSNVMRYLVESTASIARGNEIVAKGGPGPVFGYIAERFKPVGNPTRRQAFLIVDLATETDIAELMFILTHAVGTEPTFTPIMPMEGYGPAIEKAKQAPDL